ncbi:MAG: flagellar hook-basal body complex protein FliE [Parvularculaceae bacterium]
MTVATFNALRGYGAAGIAPGARALDNAAAQPAGKGDGSFNAAHALAATLLGAEKNAQSLIAGGGADPHSVIQALAQAELAVETAVTIRDKVVEAYQEILRMPV